MRELMSTKEVAEYLGLHEKKVYALVKAGKIPCTRVTGKWVFPKKLIDQWIEEGARGPVRKQRAEERPFLLAAGSDDPSLGLLRELYAQRLAPTALFSVPVGSRIGLEAVRDGIADIAWSHLLDPETGEYNLSYIKQLVPAGVVVTLFHRELGLLVKHGNPLGVRTIADLSRPGLRIINRQKGSGTRLYLDHELARLGLDLKQIDGYQVTVPTHLEVGLKVLRGEVDAGLATHAAARLLGLDFIPLTRERFDILIPKERFFSRAIQTFLETAGSREFRTRLEAVGGYDTSETGRLLATDLPPRKETG
jgi:excisionase family DNA binding protein